MPSIFKTNIYIYIKQRSTKILVRANRSKNVSSNVKLYAVPGRGCFTSAKDAARGRCSDGRAALVVVSTVIMLSNECIRTYLYIISVVWCSGAAVAQCKMGCVCACTRVYACPLLGKEASGIARVVL